MTDPRSAPDPHPSHEALGPVPDWLRQPTPEVAPGRADRWRIGLSRHSAKLLGGAAALLLLVCVGSVAATGYQGLQRWREVPVAYPTVSPPSGEQAVSSASPPPAAGPFDGTPAADFAEGAAGIALPRARRTGAFTEKQVTDALATVRKALVTGRLDRAFLTAKDPERLVRQFAPDDRATIRADFASGGAANYATRFGPSTRLTTDQPRVRGRISYRATRDADGIRVLEVTTNFVWVYAVQSVRTLADPEVILVHDTVVWQVPHPGDVIAASRGLWMQDAESYATNVECASLNKGLLELEITPSYGGPGDGEHPDAAYDLDRSLKVAEQC
ncbi:hypothetical protein CO540_11760 [Micromonospora sp. WMMA2032]|uniref:hypothetical protein n=1 Tax=Micromonospora sp. WMMA2032 TaxID=2039870 RepID=UPI000C05AB1D|nr:hypothetical protein [Micromonospora sp. WMMA2032]ATO14408.1 hypothetical protein CO540_11760 [Micromonospora sp. WMMA2032]